MTFIRTTDSLFAELQADRAYTTVQTMVAIADEHGPAIGPAAVEAIRKAASAVWQPHISILVDIVAGMRRAHRLGKAQDGWLFTNTSVQQATHPAIATHHAARFQGCSHIVEVCSGAGIDTRALARVSARVTTFEADPVTAAIVQGNLHRTGVANVNVVPEAVPCSTYREALATADGLWADPSRRDEHAARQRRGSTYDPPIGLFTTAPSTLRVLGIKVGPGDTLDADLTFRTTSEYIGWRDECRERVLWRGSDTPLVSLVDTNVTWKPTATPQAVHVVQPLPGMTLIEPHAAVIASGSVTAYFAHIGANVLDHRIGYGLCTADPGPSALHRRFTLLQVDQGIDTKRMRRQVRALGWGPGSEVKKRGVDIDPMNVHRGLDFAEGGPSGVIVLARGEAARITMYALRS